MKLPYFLTKLYFNGLEKKYRAQVQKQEVLTQSGLASRMANMNTSFSTADIIGIISLMRSCILEAIEEGYAVDGIMGMLKYSIQGNFSDIEDGYDSSRHKVKAHITLYSDILDSVNKIQVEKVTATFSGPQIIIIKDGTDEDAESDTLKVGGIAKIIGENLKVIGNDEGSTDEGIYFIATDNTETKVDLKIENNPSKLIIVIPSTLTTGNYSIQIRTYYRKGNISKTLIKNTYSNTIHIIA